MPRGRRPRLSSRRNPAFRPIDVKMGPDGAIYIADWYNLIIQHGEVDFRDERRDHTHGRIWRVTFKDRPTLDTRIKPDASIEELLDLLKTPEEWVRQHAKNMLKTRTKTRCWRPCKVDARGSIRATPTTSISNSKPCGFGESIDIAAPNGLLMTRAKSTDPPASRSDALCRPLAAARRQPPAQNLGLPASDHQGRHRRRSSAASAWRASAAWPSSPNSNRPN